MFVTSSGFDKEDYFDVFEDVSILLRSSISLSESSDISTTYLGKIPIKHSPFHPEEAFPTDAESHVIGHLPMAPKSIS